MWIFRDVQKILHIIQETTTLLGTNISPPRVYVKMIFLFPRWDMLVPWRVQIIIANYTTTNYYSKLPLHFTIANNTISNHLWQIISFPLLSATSWVLLLLTSKICVVTQRCSLQKAKRKELEKDLSLLRKEAMWTAANWSGKKTPSLRVQTKITFLEGASCTSLGGGLEIFAYIFDFHPYLGMMIQFD